MNLVRAEMHGVHVALKQQIYHYPCLHFTFGARKNNNTLFLEENCLCVIRGRNDAGKNQRENILNPAFLFCAYTCMVPAIDRRFKIALTFPFRFLLYFYYI